MKDAKEQATRIVNEWKNTASNEPDEVLCDLIAAAITEAEQGVATLTQENERLKADYQRACKTVADMHAAAIGEVGGPIRGVVEDVANLRAQLGEARKALAKIAASAPCCDGHESFNSPGQPCDQRVAEAALEPPADGNQKEKKCST